MRRARVAGAVVAAAAAAALGLTGCGGGGAAPARTAAPAAPASGQITIDAPADGSALQAGAAPGGGLRVRARTRGRAAPGATVFLSASCVPRPCTAQATAGGAGAWSARIELAVPTAGRFVTIDANAQRDVVAEGSAVATVQLVPTPRARKAIRRRITAKAKAKTKATARPSSPASSGGTPPPAAAALPHEVLVLGDSLAVGMAPALRAALPGWSVRIDAKTSRPLRVGLGLLAADPQPPAILAFSLFTNDDPRSSSALAAAVRSSATRPGGCAVWATIVAPPVAGMGYAATNRLLRGLGADPGLAPSLRIVDWAAAVAASPSLVGGDGVHATPAGYRVRAGLYADAIRSCAGG